MYFGVDDIVLFTYLNLNHLKEKKLTSSEQFEHTSHRDMQYLYQS